MTQCFQQHAFDHGDAVVVTDFPQLLSPHPKYSTSYVTVPPDEDCWRSVTLDMAPFADITQTARDPCCANDIIFVATSCGLLSMGQATICKY
jgi:hypothetical protein